MKSPAAACALVGAAVVGTYGLANQLTSVRTDVGRGVFDWERAIPFVEWTIVPYLSIGIFFAASFFVGRCRDELDRHVARLVLALALSVVCYVAFPLRFMFERPPTSGAIGLLFQLLSAIDLPYNRAPSLHIGVLVILWARFAPWLSGAWRWALHGWFATIGVDEENFRNHVYMAAVCRCFPGKNPKGGDRVPSPDEIAACRPWLDREIELLQPQLIIPVGRLAIEQFLEPQPLNDVVGRVHEWRGIDLIPLPHPSGASTWYKVAPGDRLTKRALKLIHQHPAWKNLQTSGSSKT